MKKIPTKFEETLRKAVDAFLSGDESELKKIRNSEEMAKARRRIMRIIPLCSACRPE